MTPPLSLPFLVADPAFSDWSGLLLKQLDWIDAKVELHIRGEAGVSDYHLLIAEWIRQSYNRVPLEMRTATTLSISQEVAA